MNNSVIRNHYDAFTRMQGFGGKYDGRFAPGSRAAQLFTALNGVVNDMEAQGIDQLVGTTDYHTNTHAKRLAAELVREDLRAIRDTAEAIALADQKPEFADAYLLPRTTSYISLISKAKAILEAAAPHVARFAEHEMPATFLADLAADIARFEAADDDQDDGLSDQIGGTASLSSLTAEGIQLRTQLDAVVHNKFKHDASILAEWRSAAHVVRTRRSAPAPAATA